MSWDLETAKTYLGIPEDDHSKDAQVQAAMNAVMTMGERYCNRRFLKAHEIETLYDNMSSLLLSRVPVESVNSVVLGDSTLDASTYVVDKRTGIIRCSCYSRCRCWCGCEITVDYIGGFDPLPDDLEAALYGSLGAFWARAGAPAGDPLAAAGPIKSMVLFDFARMDFDTSAQTGGGNGGGVPAALAGQVGVLDGYRFTWGIG